MLARMAVTRLAAAVRTFAVSAKYANQLKKAKELLAAKPCTLSQALELMGESKAVLHNCKGLAEEKQTITEEELLTFILLSGKFNYDDSAYWKTMDELIVAKTNDISYKNKVVIITIMQIFDVHKNSHGFEMLVRHTVPRAAKERPETLIRAMTAACAYPKVVDAKDWTALETALVQKLGSVPWDEIQRLIHELPDNCMPRLPEKIKEYMGKNISEVPRKVYWKLLVNYKIRAPEHYPEVSRIIEKASLHKLDSFILEDSSRMMMVMADMKSGSPELFAEFEALVWKKFNRLEPKNVANVLLAFGLRSRSHKVNYEKLFMHFVPKVSACVHQLSMFDLGRVADAYTLAQIKLCPLYELLSTIIVKRKDEINEISLADITRAFTNPYLNPEKHHEIYDALEPTAIMILSAGCHPDAMMKVVYNYANVAMASEKLIKVFVERMQKIEYAIDKKAAIALLGLAADLESRGVVTLVANIAKKAIMKHMKEFDLTELAEVSHIAAENE